LRFRLELGRYVIIEGQGRPHALMLSARHHDVKGSVCGTAGLHPPYCSDTKT
jgi:hypothetical protein